MRNSTADIDQRAEVSQKALDRYCSALAAVDDTSTLEQLTATIERRVRWHGKTMRALHPFEVQNYALLAAINRGEFNLIGLRNRDLQSLLYTTNWTVPDAVPKRDLRSHLLLVILAGIEIFHRSPDRLHKRQRHGFHALAHLLRNRLRLLTNANWRAPVQPCDP